MDLLGVIAIKHDGDDIYGLWFGDIFMWPDPWSDFWDEGTAVKWENAWHNQWSEGAA